MTTSPSAAPAAATSPDQAREEHRALLNHHMGKIRAAAQARDLAKAPYDAACDDLTATIDEARADLGKKKYTRKRLLSYLEDISARLRNLLAEEMQRYQDRLDLGLPVYGEQQELAFGGAETPQEAKDELFWEADGYLRGRRGDERKQPEECPPRFIQHSLKGWDRGQSETQLLYIEAQAAMQRRNNPDAAAAPKDLNAEAAAPEPGTPAARKAEKAAIAKAKAGLDKLGAKGKGEEQRAPSDAVNDPPANELAA
jgi:hypothetical protein